MPKPQELLERMFQAAVKAAQPSQCVPAHVPQSPKGRTVVVGAGKASAAMAHALEQAWDGPLSGLVVTRTGYGIPTQRIEVVEASHPVPDQAGVEASGRILDLVSNLTSDDLVICLISGGGSALMSLPAPGITLADKQDVTDALLRCGATISEINTIRKHLSAIKGGQLAAACHPAKVVALVISDVAGDDLSVIASGATVADPTTYADAEAIFAKYAIEIPPRVRQLLDMRPNETPKPGDPRLDNTENVLIATPQMALDAAARVAKEAGYAPFVVSDRLEGETSDVASDHADLVRQIRAGEHNIKPPAVVLSGGETTVTLGEDSGHGGPNAEFVLALGLALDGVDGVYALACDTDGIDGSEDNAGACLTPDTLDRARTLGLDARAHLDHHDAYSFFQTLGDLVMTGPTETNVNDFRAIIIEDASA
ncbi:glycerate kinase [Magnetovibrio sp. PR-2]|uniref:glycerate kinase type-2 family protein n=1 Tax=Magnetovibrio sp. PR-2 TaxID=3120356 RepID=UPI002FCE470E